MGYRINRAIGYGMPWERFEALCLLEPHPDFGISESLYAAFGSLTAAQMTIPKDARRGRGDEAPYVVFPSLLAEKVALNGQEVPTGRAHELYKLVMNPDRVTDVIFFPTVMHGRAWHRSDDGVDYAFEIYGRESEVSEPRDFTRYLRDGHYPYDRFLTDGNGRFAWQGSERHWEMGAEGVLTGALPQEIRWYLTQLGILSDEGVSELRPVLAQWWA